MSVSASSARRRTPAKPGRFEPSEPLHMTTRRHAARSTHVNGTPSINGSIDDDFSARGSFDEARPTTSYSLGSQQSHADHRAAGNSFGGVSAASSSFDTRMLDEPHSDVYKPRESSPIPQFSPSPSRKRKRSSQTPPETPNGVPTEFPTPTIPVLLKTYDDDGYSVVLDEQASEHGSYVSENAGAGFRPYMDLSIKPSTELTPADSEIISPTSETSNPLVLSTAKAGDTTATLSVPSQVEEREEPDEIEDANEGEDADDPDDMDDAEDTAKGDNRTRRRYYGRRRADHHVPDIEAAMRRQSQLKSCFRAISRALKPVLAEIALKTIEEIEAKPDVIEQVVEYTGSEDVPGIKQRLDDAFRARKSQLDAQLKWNMEQLQSMKLAAESSCRATCALNIDQTRESELDELQHQWLLVARRAQLNSQRQSLETEDEDGDVIRHLKGMAYRHQRTATLDPKYDSRSRKAMEVREAIADLQARFDMHRVLYGTDVEAYKARPATFTVMDNERRQTMLAQQDAEVNLQTLVAALEEEERRAKIPVIPVIPNEQATGLQLLGELVSRPIFMPNPVQLPPPRYMPEPLFGHFLGGYHQPHQPPMPPQLSQSFAQQQMPPPPLRAPFHWDGHEFDAASRNTGHRERTLPPIPRPSHTRHESLPDISRRDLGFSPASSRASPYAPLAMKVPESDFGHERNSLPPLYRHNELLGRDSTHPERPISSHMSPPERYERGNDLFQRPRYAIDSHFPAFPPPERTVHEFSRGGPLLIERIGPSEQTRALPQVGHDRPNEYVPPSDRAPLPPLSWDRPRTPDANDGRRQERVSPAPKTESSRETTEAPKIPPSRAASLNLSAADFNGSKPRQPRQPRHKGVKINFGNKSSKAERNGISRKPARPPNRPEEKRVSNGSPTRENAPSIHRFRLNTEPPRSDQRAEQRPQTPQQSQTWQASPSGAASLPAPMGTFVSPSSYNMTAAPPPSQSASSGYGYGTYPYEHKSSYSSTYSQQSSLFSGPPGSLPPPTSHTNWQHAPPSPRYTLPQPHSGPSSSAESRWQDPPPHQQSQHGFAPASSSRPGPPPFGQTLAPGPAPPPPPPSQVGGPTLAPATSEHAYYGAGTSGPHGLPAFAQQHRPTLPAPTAKAPTGGQQRRRTNSDVPSATKFHQYQPRKDDR